MRDHLVFKVVTGITLDAAMKNLFVAPMADMKVHAPILLELHNRGLGYAAILWEVRA